jgi:putrescine transport system permease protein
MAGRASGTSCRCSISRISFLFDDALYIKSYLSSLQIAFVSTLLTLLIGFPIAYGMARAPDESAPDAPDAGDPAVLDLVPDPGLRVDRHPQAGRAAQPVPALARRDRQPLEILNTNTAVYIGIVYSYLPFMVLPIYSALEKMDESLVEAARDLGCTRIGAFWLVTAAARRARDHRRLPPGVHPGMGEFVIPTCLAARTR